MNSVIRIGMLFTIGLAITIISGCAPAKVWISNPEIQTAGNPYYEARLEPVTGKYSFFVSFHLTVTNKSDNQLEINWNKTRYIQNNRRFGVFVFRGIKPEDIKNLTIPPDIIPAGDTLSKVISPYKLFAHAPIRSSTKGKAESRINPGIIPNGKNGILLVVRQNGKEVVEQMSVNIVESKIQ
ncbi:MAG: hypothetical protein JRF60_11915 [Deltaproteobacteria bacterium]|nr:hypothetical protein [Deltaproteobacteria bacterium]